MYCSSIVEEPFAEVEHFNSQKGWSDFSYTFPSHFSQNRLNQKLLTPDIMFNKSYKGHTQDQDGVTVKTEEGLDIRCEALVGCDGVRSLVR